MSGESVYLGEGYLSIPDANGDWKKYHVGSVIAEYPPVSLAPLLNLPLPPEQPDPLDGPSALYFTLFVMLNAAGLVGLVIAALAVASLLGFLK